MDGVEWLVLEDESTGLAMYRTGQIDCGPGTMWAVRQQDLESLKKSHPHLLYQDFLSNVTPGDLHAHRSSRPSTMCACGAPSPRPSIARRSSRRSGSRGEPTPAVARGLAEWSLPIDQLGAGAKYYQYDPKEARRLLAEAGFPKGFKTQLTVTGGYGRDLVDAVQLVQRYLKDVGIEAELKLQEYGAYMATTVQGKFEGMAHGPVSASPGNRIACCIGLYAPDSAAQHGPRQ